MNIIVAARRDTIITKIPGDSSEILYRVEKGAQLRVIGINKVGINRLYKVQGGGYLDAQDVQVLRDNDFYHTSRANKETRKFVMPSNLSTVGGHGLTASIGKTTNLTDSWYDLQKFIDFGNMGRLIDVTGNGGIVGGGFGGAINPNRGRNPMSENLPTITGNGGGLIPPKNTTIPATVKPTDYGDNILNMGVGQVLGINNEGAMGSLLNGVQIGNFTDGTAMDRILGNALGLLTGWAASKLSFVIGFDDTSWLSDLFKAFGTNWGNLIKIGTNSLLGPGNGTNFLTALMGGSAMGLGNKYSVSGEGSTAPSLTSGWGVHFFEAKTSHDVIQMKKFQYAEVAQSAIDYFLYKGCNGQMITKQYAGMTWTQDAFYSTMELESKKDPKEIEMWKNLYNADYSELEDSMDLIKNEFNINIDRRTLFINFNRYRVPVPDHELNLTRSYVFFTRPDLNLDAIVPDTKTNYRTSRMFPLFSNMRRAHSVLTAYLMGNEAGVDHEFIPILTHGCTGIDISDEVLETTETGETFAGWKYMYGTSLIKSKTAGTVTVTFRDDDMLSIYKIMKVWCEYINSVYFGEIMPKEQYADFHILDYAISIYYFLCKSTEKSDILFWTKYTGCFPTSIPSSNFADSLGNPVKMPTYSVPFAYARKDDYNPFHIAEFNSLCSDTNFEYLPNYNTETCHTNKSFVGAPFVDTNDGTRLFTLKFRPR